LSPVVPSPAPLHIWRVTRIGHRDLFPPSGGRSRFDDPEGGFATLYGALDRRAAFAESLQYFRPDLATRAELARLRFAEVTVPAVTLRTWAAARELLDLRLPRGANLLDLRESHAIEQVATALSGGLLKLGVSDFDSSQVVGPDRRITRSVAGWAFGEGFDGLLYPSRFAAAWTCCAFFDRIRPRVASRQPINTRDPDLTAVGASFGLRISG